ncbi:MAG: hypothetical protein KDI12_07590, partial [Anaerolineae bacterium]|nr:hypothetical protein [Anaerolineae bacterium]
GNPTGVTVTEGLDEASAHFAALEAAGISIDDVTDELLAQGVAAFSTSFDKLMTTIAEKKAALTTA